MKKLFIIVFLLNTIFAFGQKNKDQNNRIQQIKNQLTVLSTENVGLTQNVKSEIQVNGITLPNFLLAVSNLHKVNINVSPQLNNITLTNNFSNVTVEDLLVFLCKEYDLTIDFTGNILSIKKYQKPIEKPKEKEIAILYSPSSDLISIDANNDKLYDVFKKVMSESGKNLVFTPELQNKALTAYIQNTPFDKAMENLALSNDLLFEKTKDNFYVFESAVTTNANQPSNNSTVARRRSRGSNFFFEVLDKEKKLLKVNFKNASIEDVISEISKDLDVDIFTASPLSEAGTTSLKARKIIFDDLLTKIFEVQTLGKTPNSQSNSNNVSSGNRFGFKREGDMYLFGKENQLTVRKVEVVQLMHRSIELLADPSGLNSRSISGNNFNTNNSINYNGYNNQFDTFRNRNREQINTNNSGNFNSYNNNAEALVNILPDEIKQDLDVKIDYELNSFYVSGPSAKVERFKKFVNTIDKPVPVVLIEVMLIEVSKTSSVEAGVSWGLGNQPTIDSGQLFPSAEFTIGANTVNKVIGGFDGFGSFNIGRVVPNFFATIKAMETNGDIKIRSTPKLSTLNGHRATFSNGQTTYYAVTQRNIYGTDNPQTSEITNYQPLNAELGLTIKPIVSGDGQVTLDIFVVQSSFGERIERDAPPNINSRQFSSIIRVKDQDMVVLGGLEEQSKSNSGSGVPFLARIPIIKWFFSKRVRTAKKAKLTVLIKPTVIYAE